MMKFVFLVSCFILFCEAKISPFVPEASNKQNIDIARLQYEKSRIQQEVRSNEVKYEPDRAAEESTTNANVTPPGCKNCEIRLYRMSLVVLLINLL